MWRSVIHGHHRCCAVHYARTVSTLHVHAMINTGMLRETKNNTTLAGGCGSPIERELSEVFTGLGYLACLCKFAVFRVRCF